MWSSTSRKEKDQNHDRIISTDPGKAFHTIQPPFIINTLPKVDRGNIAQHKKATQDQPTANIILNGDKLIAFQLKSEEQRSPLASLLFNMELEVLPTTIRQETIMKGIQIGRKEVDIHGIQVAWQYTDDTPGDATHQLLALVNKFITAAGYNIDSRRSLPLPHANNEISERKANKTIPFKQNKTTPFKKLFQKTQYVSLNIPRRWETYLLTT